MISNNNKVLTWKSAPSLQSPNQLSTQRLKSAGEVAARSFRPSEDGFIVNTTCKLRITWPVNLRKSTIKYYKTKITYERA
jgi:hypothetical protein